MGSAIDILLITVWGAIICYYIEHHHWLYLVFALLFGFSTALRVYRKMEE